MANTATRAEKKDSRTITFKNREHEKFYKEYLPKCRHQDVYHMALIYCLGIDRDTRDLLGSNQNPVSGVLLLRGLGGYVC